MAVEAGQGGRRVIRARRSGTDHGALDSEFLLRLEALGVRVAEGDNCDGDGARIPSPPARRGPSGLEHVFGGSGRGGQSYLYSLLTQSADQLARILGRSGAALRLSSDGLPSRALGIAPVKRLRGALVPTNSSNFAGLDGPCLAWAAESAGMTGSGQISCAGFGSRARPGQPRCPGAARGRARR